MGDRQRHRRKNAQLRSSRLSRRPRQPACAVHMGGERSEGVGERGRCRVHCANGADVASTSARPRAHRGRAPEQALPTEARRGRLLWPDSRVLKRDRREGNTAPTGPTLALEAPGCGDARFESVLYDSKGLRRHFRVKRLAAYSPRIFTICICFKAKPGCPFTASLPHGSTRCGGFSKCVKGPPERPPPACSHPDALSDSRRPKIGA